MDDSGRIIHSFKVMPAQLQLRIHFEYVPSHQNLADLADLPSRAKFDSMLDVIEAATGVRPMPSRVLSFACKRAAARQRAGVVERPCTTGTPRVSRI